MLISKNTDSGISISDSTQIAEQLNAMEEESESSSAAPVALESTIMDWIKTEKESVENVSLLSDYDVEDYSILMYETKDAYNHARSLRLKLKMCEKQLTMKAKQCDVVNHEKTQLIEKLTNKDEEYKTTENSLNKRVNEFKEKLVDLTDRNSELERKQEELKALCNMWKRKASSAASIRRGDLSQSPSSEQDENKTTLRNVANTVIALSRKQLMQKLKAVNKRKDVEKDVVDIKEKKEDSDISLKEVDTLEETLIQQEVDIDVQPDEEKPTSTSGEEKNNKEAICITNQLETIQEISNKNDYSVRKLVSYCHSLIKQNVNILRKICDESQQTGMKLERWIESYMILKRNNEHGQDIYQRELKTSFNVEKEYKMQIKNLCQRITQLTREVNEQRSQIIKYETSFDSVQLNLKKLDSQFDLVSEICTKKLVDTQGRLYDLVTRCDNLQANGIFSKSPSMKKKTPTKRFSKNLFKMKRRLSESNESLHEKPM